MLPKQTACRRPLTDHKRHRERSHEKHHERPCESGSHNLPCTRSSTQATVTNCMTVSCRPQTVIEFRLEMRPLSPTDPGKAPLRSWLHWLAPFKLAPGSPSLDILFRFYRSIFLNLWTTPTRIEARFSPRWRRKVLGGDHRLHNSIRYFPPQLPPASRMDAGNRSFGNLLCDADHATFIDMFDLGYTRNPGPMVPGPSVLKA